jgi:hypothetical protein
MFYPAILETASAGRLVHLREPAQMFDELFPHLAADAIDRTPERTVSQWFCSWAGAMLTVLR